MRERDAKAAARFGILDRLQKLESDLLTVRGVTEIEFDVDNYDEIELLASAEGRSAQDDFLIREVPAPRVDYAVVALDDQPSALESPARGWCAIIGPKIASYRRSMGLTQQQLAEKTGIDQAAISRIESGRANPTLNTLDALAEGVGASLLVKII